MSPTLSVILPVFNRTALMRHPLESLRAAACAAPNLAWELIVVDDGSTGSVTDVTAAYADLPLRVLRLPENRGLLAARLAGLAQCRGEAVFFLDGDDAVAPGKFTAQLPALGNADVVYGDVARRAIDAAGNPGPLRHDAPQSPTGDPATFYLHVQPAPHNPIFRRSYLQSAVAAPLFAASRAYDPIAETWFYYQLAVRPAKITYAAGAWTIVGEPSGERLSRQWERQAAASLRLMREFFRHCPATPATLAARRHVGHCAFATWRALPRGFPPADAFLDLWRQAPAADPLPLGGPTFTRAARLLGPVTAGRLFKLYQRPGYAAIRTLEPEELARLFAS